MPDDYPALKELDMLSQGSGLFCVDPSKRSVEEIEILKKHSWRTRLHACLHEAGEFQADWVYFRLSDETRAPRPELFIYDRQTGGLAAGGNDTSLAKLYHHLWNYGRVPLALILRPTAVDIYNLLPPPEFDTYGNPQTPRPIESLQTSTADFIALAGAGAKGIKAKNPRAWKRFSARQFDSGAFWEAEENRNLAAGKNSLDSLVEDMRVLRRQLEEQTHLGADVDEKNWFVRRLLIITLMVCFFEERDILPDDYFKDDTLNISDFKSLLPYPQVLLRAIDRLEQDFNGDVFHVDPVLRRILTEATSEELAPVANFARGNMDGRQQLFWARYSFKYLPVEVISYVYEDFLGGKSQAYFTPHHLVDLLLDEAMPEQEILAALKSRDPRRADAEAAFPVLDPACGSGVFLIGAWRRLVEAFYLLEASPLPVTLRKLMTDNLFGVDLEKESVELTIFSLCVALCREFRSSTNGEPRYVFEQLLALKFPKLKGANILEGDFFVRRQQLLQEPRRYHVVIGNPPFLSDLVPGPQTYLDQTAIDEDGKRWPPVPDDQISYLFLRASFPLLLDKGTACFVQPAGLIYNQNPAEFRRQLLSNWHVSQVLDFASISGLFTKRNNTKVGVKTVAIFAHRLAVDPKKRLLHATFRRTVALNQRRVFEIDPQDLHWIPRSLAAEEPRVWKANLLGGGRLLEMYKSLTADGTLESYISRMEKERQWACGEGSIEAGGDSFSDAATTKLKQRYKPQHKPERAKWDLLDTDAFDEHGIDPKGIHPCGIEWYRRATDDRLYKPPHLLIKKSASLPLELRREGRELLFKHRIVGIACPPEDLFQLEKVYEFLRTNRLFVEFFASFGPEYLIGRQASILKKSIMDLPYSEGRKLVFRGVQEYLRDDVIEFMIPLIKDTAAAHQRLATAAEKRQVTTYANIFSRLMRSAYSDFRFVETRELDTSWCVAFHKGDGEAVKLGNPKNLDQYIESLLSNETGRSLRTWRIIRHFSGNDLFIIKPKPQRYWLKSAAVNDADAVFAWVMKRAVRKRGETKVPTGVTF